jgi:hypothetical protein
MLVLPNRTIEALHLTKGRRRIVPGLQGVGTFARLNDLWLTPLLLGS